MSEILQAEESVKLYEHEEPKSDLEDVLYHHGILGQKWGKKNGPPYPLDNKISTGKRLKETAGKIVSKRKKKKQPVYKTNEEAIQERDYDYINKNKSQFSTKEMNELMNRVNTEERMSDFTKKHAKNSKSKAATKKVLKLAGTGLGALAIAGLGYATYRGGEGMLSKTKRIIDKSQPYRKQFAKDFTTGAGKMAVRKLRKWVPI